MILNIFNLEFLWKTSLDEKYVHVN